MAKYYVTIEREKGKDLQQVLNANTDMQACVFAWERLRIVPLGTDWRVSQLGFDQHDSDKYFTGEEVAEAIAKHQKKKK